MIFNSSWRVSGRRFRPLTIADQFDTIRWNVIKLKSVEFTIDKKTERHGYMHTSPQPPVHEQMITVTQILSISVKSN